MSSVFEFFKKQSDVTFLPQLRIQNQLSRFRLKSQKYFAIGEGAQAADGNILAINVQSKAEFNVNDVEHIQFITECVALFKKKSTLLQAIDKKLVAGLVGAVAFSCLSFLPFMLIPSIACWAAVAYYGHQRVKAYEEYHESLSLLVAVCNWSLGKTNDNAVAQLINHPEIAQMMLHLYPVLTERQVKHFIADEIEIKFVQEHQQNDHALIDRLSHYSVFRKSLALSKQAPEFYRCIYGFNKGKPVDFLDALCSAIPDLYRVIAMKIKNTFVTKTPEHVSSTTASPTP